MNMESLYQLTTAHSLTAMVSFSLEKVIELPRDFDQQKKKVIRKLALFDVEREKLFRQLDNAEIWYMPLKGVVLKDYYPRYGMREMSDNDILCDVERMSDVKRIMESQGFQCTEYGKRVDDIYFKFPLTFEMHRYLFDKNELESLYSYFKNIKEKLLLVDDSRYEYRFTPEDLYVYLTAHEYKHFIHGGTGIRSLLDTYVFLKHNNKELYYYSIKRFKIRNQCGIMYTVMKR